MYSTIGKNIIAAREKHNNKTTVDKNTNILKFNLFFLDMLK